MLGRFFTALTVVGLAGACFFIAFYKPARRFIVHLSVWRGGNNEQQRMAEHFVTAAFILFGFGVIIFWFSQF